ncbi:MAG: RluA family pseudouridine synthase [Desulfobulbaceae bacterium]|nr:RluA family pseudouridine synthase [Desulfobulbaceae bacterium]
MVKSRQSFSFIVPGEEAGLRLDLFLVRHLSEFSRSALYRLIQNDSVQVNGDTPKAGYRIREGDRVDVVVPEQEPSDLIPEQVYFAILYEDESVLVLAKPPGVVVHPAAGHSRGTLAHGLLFHCTSLPGPDKTRPGLVHRLDKDTSGIMLVAKNENALKKLTEDFRNRKVQKIYHALLLRCPREEEGRIVAAIGRHPVNRKKMAVVRNKGRYAATKWRILESFANGMGLAEIDLETGRTHQIRVHMSSIGCPVAGDTLYGGKIPDSFALDAGRQLLHSSTIRFAHPDNGELLTFTSPLWPDIQDVLECLRRQSAGAD